MKRTLRRGGIAGLVLATGLGAFAATQFEGQNIYVTGEAPIDNWAPGGNAALQLLDDGTNGDATADDGIWTRDVTISGTSSHPDNRAQWKVGSSDWSISVPSGTDNSYTRPVDGAVTKFLFDTNTYNDGFVPDPDGSALKGFLYTVPSPILGTDTVRVAGDFVSQIGGNNWDPASPAGTMNDAGTNGDATAGDGIFTLQFTGVAAGGYEFKVTLNGGWDMQVATNGFATGGGNFGIAVLDASDVITIEMDSAKGRVKVTNSNPLASPGPPFFAVNDSWGYALDSTTQLYDDGTNGDVTSGDGIHSRVFTVNDVAATTVSVRQGQGPNFPGTGTYPMNITSAGQQVLVQFDTNSYADGYSPSGNYVWTDPASRRIPPYVQAIGDFMFDMGGAGDWNNADPNFELFDGGTGGDATAGDNIFAKTFSGAPSISGKQWKAIGLSGSWDYQFGGSGDGYTFIGNNPTVPLSHGGGDLTFQVDATTGRIGLGTSTPARPATINASASSSVSDWALFN